jgi:outer membrane protein assembly factor BamB
MNAMSYTKKAIAFRLLLTIAVMFSIWGPNDIRAGTTRLESTNTELSGAEAKLSPVSEEEVTAAVTSTSKIYLPFLSTKPAAPEVTDGWPMAGANPRRTSWTSEQVPSAEYMASHRNQPGNGLLHPQWAKPIEAYIPQKVQVIAANDTLYISTSRGLYALDSATGATKWIFPTELPLGHSPTIDGDVAYVGGLDHRLYAIDAFNGTLLWSYDGAGAGFDTNPLVVNQMIYAGNRDGYMYAIYADQHELRGQLAWRYKTDGPIHFSAAFDGTTIYFASDDSYAYALDAQTGNLVWKSSKMLGAGFHSWWPVVYDDAVIFAGSSLYRDNIRPGTSPLAQNIDNLDRQVLQGSDPNDSAYAGKPLGQRGSDGWIATSQSVSIAGVTANIGTYYESKPWRRTYFVLDKSTGQEISFDFDGDGTADYAPFLWFGPQSGNRYPPVVGSDSLLYQAANIYYNPWIGRGMPVGWRYGTPYVSTPSAQLMPIDEPIAYAAGGSIVYWIATGPQYAGAFDLAKTNTRFWDSGSATMDQTREWLFWGEGLNDIFPGYDVANGGGLFGGRNGTYGDGGDQNPPIPYQGRVYFLKGNSVVALAPQSVTPVVLSTAPVVEVPAAESTTSVDTLKQSLVQEVQKITAAGHLKPGFFSSGLIDLKLNGLCADQAQDYFHGPADTLYTLLRALPYLPSDVAQSTRTYLQSEFAAYSPLSVNHVGWKVGAKREAYDIPPEVATDMANMSAARYILEFPAWSGDAIPPFTFYALWKYAQEFGGAQQLFAQAKGKLRSVPSDDVLAKFPFAHNAYIAGYIGYVELARLAGDTTEATNKQTTLNTLLAKRVSNFNKDTPYTETNSNTQPAVYCRSLSISRNFTYMVPELGDYLRSHALAQVQAAVDEYNTIAPYWFVSWFEDSVGEAEFQPLYDVNGVFSAKAMVLDESRTELAKYVDAPGFARGDLFYIQNLIMAIEAP